MFHKKDRRGYQHVAQQDPQRRAACRVPVHRVCPDTGHREHHQKGGGEPDDGVGARGKPLHIAKIDESAKDKGEIDQRHVGRRPQHRPCKQRQGCHGLAYRNAERQKGADRGEPPEMLRYEELHGAVEDAHLVDVAPLRALTLEMDDRCLVHVEHLPSSPAHTITPVQVFAVHEKRLIEPPDLLVDRSPDHHKRPAHCIDGVRFCRVEIGQVVPTEEPAVGEEAGESEHFREGHPRRGKTPPARELEAPVRIEHLASGETRLRVLLKECEHHPKRVFLDHRVGVDQEDKLPRSLMNGHVVGPGEADILGVLDQMHGGERAAHHRCAPVIRGVVHHKHLTLDARHCPGDRRQRILKE